MSPETQKAKTLGYRTEVNARAELGWMAWEETAEEQQLMDPGFGAGGHTSPMSRLGFQPIGALLSLSHEMWQGTVV